MGYQEIINLKNSSKYNATSRADFVTAINVPVLKGNKSYFISARTIYGIFINDMNKARALMSALQAFDANIYQMMLVPGDEKGTSGGMDMGLATTQFLVDQLCVAANQAAGITLITDDDIAAIKAFGQVWKSEAQDCGFGTISANQVDFALDYYNNYVTTQRAINTRFAAMMQQLDAVVISANQGNAVASLPTIDDLYTATGS